MPRKTESSKEIIVRLSHEQYQALLQVAEAQGYTSIAEFVRDHLSKTIPSFDVVLALAGRGKYKRKNKSAPPPESGG
jgi:hypothetical protein